MTLRVGCNVDVDTIVIHADNDGCIALAYDARFHGHGASPPPALPQAGVISYAPPLPLPARTIGRGGRYATRTEARYEVPFI
jgi:hypothetical protein